MIPYGHQSVSDDDVAAVVDVLGGEWLTQGPKVEEFEHKLAQKVGADHAVAFSSGTAALHAATSAGGLGPGDVVATSPLSFVASANCIRYVGAEPRFVDIDATTLNMDLAQVPERLDGLVAVHYAGLPIDLSQLHSRPRVIIEDACHALGAATPHGPVGACAQSDMCVFSFHPVKHITTCEGGAVTTNDVGLASSLRRFRNHGIVSTPARGGWSYDVTELGYNYRLSDVHAALGGSQLGELDRFVARRTLLAERYRDLLCGTAIELPPVAPPGFTHAWHIFPVRVDRRRELYDGLRYAGVGVQVHYVPIYQHSIYASTRSDGGFPKTEAAYESLLTLPLWPGMSDLDQDFVVDRLLRIL